MAGLFNKFPFTNFHEVNTDWIVREVKAVGEQLTALDSKITADMLALAKQVKAIQDDVNTKLEGIEATIAQKAAEEVERLVNEGRFDELIAPALEQLSKDLQDDIGNANTIAGKALANTNKTQYLNTLANKSILIIGDSNSDESFTQNGNITKHWTSELKNILSSKASGNSTTVVNRSKAGSAMEYAKTILTEINATSSRYDVIIIMLGTNDYNSNTDYATFLTTLEDVSKLLQPHVTAKGSQVYFVSPPKRTFNFRDREGQIPLVVYAKSIYKNCIKWGFNFIDAWCKIPEINIESTESRKAWLSDQYLHFNDAFAPVFANWILGYISENKSDTIGDYYDNVRGVALSSYFTNTNNFTFDADNSYLSVGTRKTIISVRGKLKQGGGNTTGLQPIMNVPSWMISSASLTPLDCMWTSFSRGTVPEKTTAFINNGAKTLYADITGNSTTGKTYFINGTVENIANESLDL